MKAITIFGLFLAATLSIQSLAGELGRSSISEGQGHEKVGVKQATPEKFKWINGLCFDLRVTSAGVVEDYRKAVETCPQLRDYSQAVASYAERKNFSVPPHQPGSICRTKTFWTWAIMVGPPGDKCRAPKADGTFTDGVLI